MGIEQSPEGERDLHVLAYVTLVWPCSYLVSLPGHRDFLWWPKGWSSASATHRTSLFPSGGHRPSACTLYQNSLAMVANGLFVRDWSWTDSTLLPAHAEESWSHLYLRRNRPWTLSGQGALLVCLRIRPKMLPGCPMSSRESSHAEECTGVVLSGANRPGIFNADVWDA